MRAKRPTSEMTHGRNDPVPALPGVSMDRLIFRRLVIPSKGSYCECQQTKNLRDDHKKQNKKKKKNVCDLSKMIAFLAAYNKE